jgi:hypothetical protein
VPGESRAPPREDAGRFVEEVRGDDPELAEDLRIEERELEGGGPKLAVGSYDCLGGRRRA